MVEILKNFLRLVLLVFNRKAKKEDERKKQVEEFIADKKRAIKAADVSHLNALIAKRKRLRK